MGTIVTVDAAYEMRSRHVFDDRKGTSHVARMLTSACLGPYTKVWALREAIRGRPSSSHGQATGLIPMNSPAVRSTPGQSDGYPVSRSPSESQVRFISP